MPLWLIITLIVLGVTGFIWLLIKLKAASIFAAIFEGIGDLLEAFLKFD